MFFRLVVFNEAISFLVLLFLHRSYLIYTQFGLPFYNSMVYLKTTFTNRAKFSRFCTIFTLVDNEQLQRCQTVRTEDAIPAVEQSTKLELELYPFTF